MRIEPFLDKFPLIAIFRGITPEEVVGIAEEVVSAGFQILEVPLNSPRPLESIELLARKFPDLLIGAGTVMSGGDVRAVAQAGGKLILMPHSDPAVLRQAKESGMLCVPGVATPTEAFAALGNGADALKLYPAEQITPAVVKAWRAIMSPAVRLLPVGGIVPESMQPYLQAGANGFGLGSALYKSGFTAEQTGSNARRFRDVLENLVTQGQRQSPGPI
ncbi:2-dehydro-3-deoxy-6-phosphogalactonate aldolase [Pollutimonas subterranea]|uniref:2-dehydro-3-deoxy-6-phosphogalactonate aldolase n=1 Tax=Pollutimonas subterranea TaxID=2045210 RepID=A0A2N4U3C1_9BURK|nr:2-dehydro-3-deoxy-6-phosphogalactonate aldolase [Pollutimonas subterranea]PLC49493.1 2-dehydro-3-deoxy-6-phosphogalactonate aldolase [Pollutimonas subterranea]